MRDILKKLMLITMAVVAAMVAYAKENQTADVKVTAEIKKNGFVGEALTYEVTLMSTSSDMANVRVLTAPKFPNDTKVIQGAARGSRPSIKKVNGKEYYCWTIMRSFVIPGRSGKLSIAGGRYIAFVPHEKIAYHPFWGKQRVLEYEEMELTCNNVNLKISNLPKKNGMTENVCVGEFKIEGWFPPGRINKGQEAYAVFTIGGFGSLETLKLPNLNKLFGKGCRLKEVDQNEEQLQRDGRLYTEVTLTCKFVAEEDEFEIAPLCLEFFSPDTKKYYETCSETLHWTGTPSEKKKGSSTKDAIKV